jgi:recombinational DNA repair protein (RecF pathway)
MAASANLSHTINSVALCADSMPATQRFLLKFVALTGIVLMLTACAGVGTSVGISVPIGRAGGVGVSIGSGGTVSGTVGVGVGGGSVSEGASGQLPKKAEPEAEKKEDKKP